MKNYLLLLLIISFIIGGCEKDDGFRTVMIELEIDAIPNSGNDYLYCYTKLFELQSGDEILKLTARMEQGDPKMILKSDQKVLPVGYEVARYFAVDSNSDEFPCDATFRVKSDNKVIYTHTAKKGDLLFDGPFEILKIK
jgi:hypothetical protein